MLQLRRVTRSIDQRKTWWACNMAFYKRLGITKKQKRVWFVKYARTTGKISDTYACLRLCAARGDPFAARNLATFTRRRLGVVKW